MRDFLNMLVDETLAILALAMFMAVIAIWSAIFIWSV